MKKGSKIKLSSILFYRPAPIEQPTPQPRSTSFDQDGNIRQLTITILGQIGPEFLTESQPHPHPNPPLPPSLTLSQIFLNLPHNKITINLLYSLQDPTTQVITTLLTYAKGLTLDLKMFVVLAGVHGKLGDFLEGVIGKFREVFREGKEGRKEGEKGKGEGEEGVGDFILGVVGDGVEEDFGEGMEEMDQYQKGEICEGLSIARKHGVLYTQIPFMGNFTSLLQSAYYLKSFNQNTHLQTLQTLQTTTKHQILTLQPLLLQHQHNPSLQLYHQLHKIWQKKVDSFHTTLQQILDIFGDVLLWVEGRGDRRRLFGGWVRLGRRILGMEGIVGVLGMDKEQGKGKGKGKEQGRRESSGSNGGNGGYEENEKGNNLDKDKDEGEHQKKNEEQSEYMLSFLSQDESQYNTNNSSKYKKGAVKLQQLLTTLKKQQNQITQAFLNESQTKSNLLSTLKSTLQNLQVQCQTLTTIKNSLNPNSSSSASSSSSSQPSSTESNIYTDEDCLINYPKSNKQIEEEKKLRVKILLQCEKIQRVLGLVGDSVGMIGDEMDNQEGIYGSLGEGGERGERGEGKEGIDPVKVLIEFYVERKMMEYGCDQRRSSSVLKESWKQESQMHQPSIIIKQNINEIKDQLDIYTTFRLQQRQNSIPNLVHKLQILKHNLLIFHNISNSKTSSMSQSQT